MITRSQIEEVTEDTKEDEESEKEKRKKKLEEEDAAEKAWVDWNRFPENILYWDIMQLETWTFICLTEGFNVDFIILWRFVASDWQVESNCVLTVQFLVNVAVSGDTAAGVWYVNVFFPPHLHICNQTFWVYLWFFFSKSPSGHEFWPVLVKLVPDTGWFRLIVCKIKVKM